MDRGGWVLAEIEWVARWVARVRQQQAATVALVHGTLLPFFLLGFFSPCSTVLPLFLIFFFFHLCFLLSFLSFSFLFFVVAAGWGC